MVATPITGVAVSSEGSNYVISFGTTRVTVKKEEFRTEADARLITLYRALCTVIKNEKVYIGTGYHVLDEALGDIVEAALIDDEGVALLPVDDSPEGDVGKLKVRKHYNFRNNFTCLSYYLREGTPARTLYNLIVDELAKGESYQPEIRKKAITEMRNAIVKGVDFFVNKAEHHHVVRPTGKAYSVTDDLKSWNNEYLRYQYYTESNLDRYSDLLRNNFAAVDAFIKHSEKICFLKGGYHLNNIVERTQTPLLEYEDSDYFFDQQKESIYMMERLEAENVFLLGDDKVSIPGTMNGHSINRVAIKTNFGILANNPGTGKTRITAAMVLRNAIKSRDVNFRYEPGLAIYVEDFGVEHKKFDEFTRVNKYYNINTTQNWQNKEKRSFIALNDVEYEKEDATLVVVSISTFPQWKDEFDNIIEEFGLEGKVVFHCMKEKTRGAEVSIPMGCDVILTTSTFYERHICKIDYPIMFNRIVFDEPDTIRYPLGNEKTQGRFKWLVSATIGKRILDDIDTSREGGKRNTYTRIGDIEAAGLEICGNQHGILEGVTVFVPKDSVDNSKFLNFIEYQNFEDTVFIDKFKDNFARIDPALAEALAAGDEATIARILGATEGRMCKMDRIYNKHLRDLENLLKLKEKQPERMAVIKKDLAELDKKLKETLTHKADECPVCLCELELDDAILFDCCFLMAHKGCTGLLTKTATGGERCIACRACPTDMYNFADTICYDRIVNTGEEPPVAEETPAAGSTATKAPKKRHEGQLKVRNDVFSYVFEKENSRCLIYATCGENDGIKTFIESLGYSAGTNFNILKGTVTQRARMLSAYKSGLVPILILLHHKNAAGLNLTHTTDLIVWNRTSDAILKQVVGRVDRLGLDHNVNIHLLDKFESTLGAVKEKYSDCKVTTLDISKGVTFGEAGL